MLDLIVTDLRVEAEDVLGIELRAADGDLLPQFTAGSHLDLHLPGQIIRQYSLCNDPSERHRYCLGVGLSASSRGGSSYIHQQLKVGDRLIGSEPRSLFSLDEKASEHMFVAGGIGITPILSMIYRCESVALPWKLLYCVRTRKRAAGLSVLTAYDANVTVHADDEASGTIADLASFLRVAKAGAHVYSCGPAALMDAVSVAASSAGFPGTAVHFERFSASPLTVEGGQDRPFFVRLAKHGGRFQVTEDKSILQTLEESDVALPFSCREGLCRSCEVHLLAGEADHRDFVLSDAERDANTSILICVSRSKTEELVLDI